MILLLLKNFIRKFYKILILALLSLVLKEIAGFMLLRKNYRKVKAILPMVLEKVNILQIWVSFMIKCVMLVSLSGTWNWRKLFQLTLNCRINQIKSIYFQTPYSQTHKVQNSFAMVLKKLNSVTEFPIVSIAQSQYSKYASKTSELKTWK